MKWDEVFSDTFQVLKKNIKPIVKQEIDLMIPSMKMVEVCRANDFDFFQPVIDAGRLTVEQMHHAAARYWLGKTKNGQPMFWMIDDIHRPLDAHIGDTWISHLLKVREPLLKYWCVQHCLFGLHLTSYSCFETWPVCIVESESSAVILSELFPEYIWLAYGTISHANPNKFTPLKGRRVTIYPRTDPNLSTYLFFLDLAAFTRQIYGLNLHIDSTLENHATAEQKQRCIDILDFILES